MGEGRADEPQAYCDFPTSVPEGSACRQALLATDGSTPSQPLVGNDPSRPTGGSVRKGVPDLGPGGPRAPMGAAQRENFEHLRGLEAIF